jgi:hypothetical protein
VCVFVCTMHIDAQPARACLGYPCAAGLNDDETWLDKNGKSIVIGVLIAGGILGCLSFTAIVILSNGYCGTGTQESGVWDT